MAGTYREPLGTTDPRGAPRGRHRAHARRRRRERPSPARLADTLCRSRGRRQGRLGGVLRRRSRHALRRAVRARPGVRAAVAAGHPATAEAGLEILADGGTQATRRLRRARILRRRDGHDRLLAGGHAIVWDGRLARTSTASSRCRAEPASKWWTSPCRSARRPSTTPLGLRRALSPGSRAGWTRSGANTGGCHGRGSSSRHCGSRARGQICPRGTRPVWPCSSRS